MRLYELAHSRTGDKGNASNISVIAYQPAHYLFLVETLTVERVREHLGDLATGCIERYELPQLHAMNFVIYNALAGGVTRSLALDAHGKALSSILLAMELPTAESTTNGEVF